MGDRESRAVRLRYTATGALAALAVAGAIAGTVALADGPPAKTPGQPTPPIGVTKTAPESPAPEPGIPGKKPAPAPGASGKPSAPAPGASGKPSAPAPSAGPQPFLNAVQQLVANSTITATEGQAVDREILSGRVDTQALASEGFSAGQLQIVQQALANTKRALAPSVK